jgi:DNA-binding NtrC family response regulator
MASPGPSDVAELGAVVGRTPEMLEIHKLIGQVATTDAAVLIQGESGTGKELAARAIHYNSERGSGPFVVVSCGALRGGLLDVELFGSGAADGEVPEVGRFELADGGTIFLSDIDEISPSAQGRVLSILESGHFERPHTRNVVPINVRVVAATNRSLVDRMKDGSFRVDLFYRLKVVTIFMPPLRDRRDDILCLAEHFVERASARMQRGVSGMSLEVIELLKEYPWPGNVRELEQAIQRAVALNRTGVLVPDDFEIFRDRASWPRARDGLTADLPGCVGARFGELAAAGESNIDRAIVSEVECVLAREALRLADGNQVKAARALGISRNTLRKRLQGPENARAGEPQNGDR